MIKPYRKITSTCESKATIVQRSMLVAELWGSDNVFTSKTMHVYINRLRCYLEGDKSVEILTIRGMDMSSSNDIINEFVQHSLLSLLKLTFPTELPQQCLIQKTSDAKLSGT